MNRNNGITRIMLVLIVTLILITIGIIIIIVHNNKISKLNNEDLTIENKVEIVSDLISDTKKEDNKNEKIINEYINALEHIEVPDNFVQQISASEKFDWGSIDQSIELKQTENATVIVYETKSIKNNGEISNTDTLKAYYNADGTKSYQWHSYNSKWETINEGKTNNYRQTLKEIKDLTILEPQYNEDGNKVIITAQTYIGNLSYVLGSKYFSNFLNTDIAFVGALSDKNIDIELIFDKNNKRLIEFSIINNDKYSFKMTLKEMENLEIEEPKIN